MPGSIAKMGAMRRINPFLIVVVLLVAIARPALVGAAPAKNVDYMDPQNWLCLPGRADACAQPLTSTVIGAGGSVTKRTYTADANAPVDCFYVYPTVSRESTANADMTASPEVQHVALEQFERFGARCRLYAPLYRQVTLAGLRGEVRGIDLETPYNDVFAAWNTYLARYNNGRGVVLIGHSQGSKILARLIASEIDGTAEQRWLISAIILGEEIDVPAGRDVGGTFKHLPLCRSVTQVACVIAYSSYLATPPPDQNAHFGSARAPRFVGACVDPAALQGHTILNAELPPLTSVGRSFGTTFIETRAQLGAECTSDAGHSYLAISPGTDPSSAVLTIALQGVQTKLPGWGLHVLDVNLSLGNLIDLVGTESKAWLAASP
jgi:hypothetical protein